MKKRLYKRKCFYICLGVIFLSDHDGQEYGTNHTICRHKNLNFGTISFHLFDDQFVLYYILGNPCRHGKDSTILQTVRWKEMLQQG